MDSPDSTKIVASKSAASPAVQDSPFFNYLSNLSPINPVKAAHVVQGFSELNIPSPLPVFTSPRINLPREMKFLRRLRYSSSSSAELPLDQRDQLNDPQLMIGLKPCAQKERDNKGSEQVQPCSPSGCVNEYLADMVGMESVDNDCSSDSHDAAQMSVSVSSRSGKAVGGPDDGGGPSKDTETEVVLRFTSLEQGEEELDENLLLQVESAKQQKDHEEQFVQFTSVTSERVEDTILPDSSLVPAPGEQDCQQVLPDSLQTIHNFENHDQLTGGMSTESVEDRISYDFQDAGQHQRGTRRRCLQFEAAEAHKSANNCERRFSDTVNVIACASSSANSSELDMIDSCNLNLTATLSNVLPNNFSLPTSSKSSLSLVEVSETQDKFNRSVRNGGRTSTKAPKPSGIGLHLNSIVNATAVGCNAPSGMDSADYPTAEGEKSLSVTKHHLPEGSSSNPLPSSVAIQFSVKIDDNQQERIALVSDSPANLQLPQGNVDKVGELNQLSPKRKRKRAPYTVESEGCKRCNCKRSKCLKLYCECFAAGIYCAEPCSCVECFNKPEYEDTVLGTRQQIESRNPLAFAPKIVQCTTGSPVINGEDGGRTTPSSARHKRGCNCKKSMCLKKYCECYQAGVGCSDGCRCEGCKNIFGIKEGYGEINDMEYKKSDDENWEDPSDQKLDMLDTRDKYVRSAHSHKLMPQTPLLQSSNRKELLKPWHPARRYLHSPESDSNTSSSYGKPSKSPRTLSGHDKGVNRGDPNLDDLFCDQELAFNATVGVDQFSPRRNGLEDLCDFTPLPLPPSRVMASSSSSNAKESTKTSHLQLHGSVHLSGSFRLHGSSVTPIHCLGGSKLQEEPESDNGCGIMEDDTPEILKDSSTPIKAVKASSPNQKRISPPHSRFNELRSSSSPGLRSGRKFVLQSISSFPPLTPYGNSKGSTDN